MRKLIAVILFILIWSSVGFAATRIALEDFESITPGDIPSNDPTGSGEISQSGRAFYGSAGNGAFINSGGSRGNYARAHIIAPAPGGNSYTQPKWRFDNTIGGGKEVYVKFDLRLDADLESVMRDFKFVTITDNTEASDASSWHPHFQFKPNGGYTMYSWGGSEYYMSRAIVNKPNHLKDNQWHTYEVFINIGTGYSSDKNSGNHNGVVKLWEDGELLLHDNSVPFRSSNSHHEINSMGTIWHVFSGGANMNGYLYFDNLEVWDGMPDGGVVPPSSDSEAPTIPINLQSQTISSSEIDLSWDASTDNVGVTGYRIYRDGVEIDTNSNVNYQDTGLSPLTTYTYTVSAYDAAGNQSGQSSSANATTNDSTTFSQYYETESMNLVSPMVVGNNSQASAGQYISPTSGSNTTSPQPEATVIITVPDTGIYYYWVRMMGPDAQGDALYVGIDTSWDRVYPSAPDDYEWVRVETSQNSENFGFNLAAGDYTLQIGHGEINAQADTLFLTNDPNEIPISPDTVPPVPPIGLTFGM